MRYLLLILVSFWMGKTYSQLTVTTGTMTPTQYVQNVLIGSGVTVSNVTFNAPDPNQIGTFDATNTNPYIGIGNGLIMATGDVNVAIGPNNNTGATLGNGMGFGVNDPDLDIIAAIGTNDAAVLEFDFIPTGDTVKFNFVFGSEEYPEYVGSINDAFGFFLSGPGIAGPFSNGAINIALVPGTTTPVTINNVNSGSNPSYYIDNNNQAGPPNAIQFDGYTTVMTAIGIVQCGQQYHIKIAIADASDDILDSGVFLEAGSFSSNTITLSSNVDVGGNDSILYEGCGQALLDFVRSDTLDSAVYYFTITGSASTSDYTISADSVLFLPSQDTVTLTFEAIQDGLNEPMETVIIELVQTICSVQDTQRVTFYIADYPIPILNPHDTIIGCNSNDSVPVWVDVSGPPYNLQWNTGATTDTLWVKPTVTTTYFVTVSDTCGVYNILDSAIVDVVSTSPLILNVSDNDTLYCPQDQDQVNIYASASGGGGGITYNWTPGNITDSSFTVSLDSTTIYVVTIQDVCGSIIQDSVTITVSNPQPLQLTLSQDTLVCVGDTLELFALATGGAGGYTYNWSGQTMDTILVIAYYTENYTVTVTDFCGSTISGTVSVSVTKPTAEFSYEYLSETKVEFEDSSYNNIVANWWSFDPTNASLQLNQTHTFFTTGEQEVWLAVQDINGCKDTVLKVISPPIILYAPNSFTPDGNGKNDFFTLKGIGIKSFSMLIYNRWGELLFQTDDINKGWDGTYKGELVPIGVYIYRAKAMSYKNEGIEKTGNVNVLR